MSLQRDLPSGQGWATADPVVSALAARASELSLALTPQAIGRKLREELVAQVGPDRATAYYVGVSTDDGETIKFEIARLGPRFLARLTGDDQQATLKLSYEHTTGNGWRISIGAAAAAPYQRPKGARLQGSFAVTISR